MLTSSPITLLYSCLCPHSHINCRYPTTISYSTYFPLNISPYNTPKHTLNLSKFPFLTIPLSVILLKIIRLFHSISNRNSNPFYSAKTDPLYLSNWLYELFANNLDIYFFNTFFSNSSYFPFNYFSFVLIFFIT